MTLTLHEQGAFTWTEWAEALSSELALDPTDDGSRYYEHWVAALERLTNARNLTAPRELEARKDAWKDAYLHTPHGQPVSLSRPTEPSPYFRAEAARRREWCNSR